MPLFNAIRKLYHLTEPLGFSYAELRVVEERLCSPLPDALRDYYRWFGHRANVNQVQDSLVLPQGLKWEDDYLEIYHENQWAWHWAIRREDMALSNPPVFIHLDLTYKQSFEKLTDFFVSAAYMTAMFSLPEQAGEFEALKLEAIPEIEKSFRKVAIPMPIWRGAIHFYANTDDSVLAVCSSESDTHILWAASEKEDMADMNALLAPIIERFGA